jgi:hypothetical protein
MSLPIFQPWAKRGLSQPWSDPWSRRALAIGKPPQPACEYRGAAPASCRGLVGVRPRRGQGTLSPSCGAPFSKLTPPPRLLSGSLSSRLETVAISLRRMHAWEATGAGVLSAILASSARSIARLARTPRQEGVSPSAPHLERTFHTGVCLLPLFEALTPVKSLFVFSKFPVIDRAIASFDPPGKESHVADII